MDALAILAKGAVGACPYVGTLMAEVVGTLIPNQRIDRIAKLLEVLAAKVAEHDQVLIEQRMKSASGVDLMEDAFYAAARALSDGRIEYIADIFKKGVTEDQEDMTDAKRLMWLLAELSDAEVLLLAWYNMGPQKDEEFQARHWEVVRPRSAEMGRSQEEIDESTLYESRKTHMANLGLMRPRFKHVRKGESPEFDPKTGMMKASGYEVTPLGRLLIRTIDAK